MSNSTEAGIWTAAASDYIDQTKLAFYCIVASSALLWFDCILTFEKEVQCMWRRRFTGATVVYLATRYFAVLERIISVLYYVLWDINDHTCNALFWADNVLSFLIFTSCSVFTILRVYGICNRSWFPLLFVVPLGLVSPIIFLILNAPGKSIQGGQLVGCIYSSESLAWDPASYCMGVCPHCSSLQTPCDVLVNTSIVFTIGSASTIVMEVIVVGITWRRTYGMHKESKSLRLPTSFATLLLVDGTVYFLALILTQAANITSNVIEKLYFWYYFANVFTVIFQSRLILGLRALYFSDTRDSELPCQNIAYSESGHSGGGGQVTTIRFAISSAVVGNLGAPLAVQRGEFDADVDGDGEQEEGGALPESMRWPVFARDPFREGMEIEAKLALQSPGRAGPRAESPEGESETC